jgi:LPXTG-site transpeptidase (sortase) family protein
MSGARAGVRGLGELLITAGLVLLLFCGYQLVWTNFEADRAQNRVSDTLRQEWLRQGGSQSSNGTIRLSKSDFGKGFAFLHIPRLGRKYSVPVVQGVSLPDLSRGVGHYPSTALPGQVGNFAVAGHRATHGQPFAYLDQVKVRDSLVVETRTDWFTYVVDKVQIVQPTDVWVIEPVPGKPKQVPTRQLITLTTCNPRWASTQRLIVFGHLTATQPAADGRPPALAESH